MSNALQPVLNQTEPQHRYDLSWKAATLMVVAFASLHVWLATAGWHSPLVGQHGFRQTQTAMAAYWMLHGGPWLAYETPVLGPPWSIPFEFPLYQWVTAVWSWFTGMELDQSGRAVGLMFFYSGLAVINWMIQRLRLPVMTFVAFAVFYLTSPLYLFWSRAFLIETTAVGFSLAYLATAVVGLKCRQKPLFFAAAFFGSLAALVKVTTFSGALAAVFLFGVITVLRNHPNVREAGLFAVLALVCPVAWGGWWVHFSDAIKLQNPLQHLTSSDLRTWNLGSLGLRFSRPFWSVLYHRTLPDLLGQGWPLVVMAACLAVFYQRRKVRLLAVAAFAAFCAPMLLFAPLHFIHNYYPSGTAAYLYVGLAVLGGSLWPAVRWKQAVFISLAAVVVIGNVSRYRSQYLPDVYPAYNQFLAAAEFLKANTSASDVILVYGNSWNSTIPYYSGRRAIMDTLYRPLDSPEMHDAIAGLRPEQRITAVVACLKARQGWYAARVSDSVARVGFDPSWRYDNGTCRVFLPGTGLQPPISMRNDDPAGSNVWLRMVSESGPQALGSTMGPNPGLAGVDIEMRAAGVFPPAPTEDASGALAILAAPGTQLWVAAPHSASGVNLQFGVGEYAWKTPHAPPVVFTVDCVLGRKLKQIWTRSLDPGGRREDRGSQSVQLTIPPATDGLVLATSSSRQSSGHRAYWSGIRFH